MFTQERLVAALGETVAGRVLTGVTVASIANAGRVAYGGQFASGSDAFSGGNFVEDALVVMKGDTIDGTELRNIFAPSVNNNGDIAFVSLIPSPAGPSLHGVFTANALVAAPGVTIDGRLITNVFSGTIPALNDSGDVAFSAFFDVIGLPFAVGIFTQDRLVVATGDAIEGNTVDTLELLGVLPMNNKGQLTFVANFVDGTSAVVLASPLRPDLLTERVDELVEEGALDPTRGDVLKGKVADAEGKLDEGKIKTAVNQLEAFINMVQSLVNSGGLTPEEGQLLIDAAQQVIAELEG